MLRLFQYDEEKGKEKSKVVSAKEAENVAHEFLQKVVKKEVVEKLSKANEYTTGMEIPRGFSRSFSYTRMENKVPFLENGFQITIGSDGKVEQFSRQWYEGKMPEVAPKLSGEEATKKLDESLQPSLKYIRLSDQLGDWGPGLKPYSLVYMYDALDPLMVDATKGEALNRLGQKTNGKDEIKPLGSTTSDKETDRRITKEEAQQIADELIAKIPGSYTSQSNGGYGTGTGPDGIVHRSWSFNYVASNAKEDAVQMVKTLFPDRLGELYLIDNQPTAEMEKAQVEERRSFNISFGWLKDGIPVENARIDVIVNAESGKISNLWTGQETYSLETMKAIEKNIDAKTAKSADSAKKKVMLTYFQSAPDWRYGMTDTKKTEPILVYRYVGDESVVDAKTGDWISFKELREKLVPQDIDDHPKKDALLFAIDRDILKVKDGKVEPNKEVTRGEFISMVMTMSQRLPIQDRMYRHFDNEEAMKPYLFQDVDVKDHSFAAIQQAVQMGIVPREGKTFKPNTKISRMEAANMLVRLVGYEKLLNKTEIFKTNFTDVNKKDIAVAALAEALGIFDAKGKTFNPEGNITRAEIAVICQTIAKMFEEQ